MGVANGMIRGVEQERRAMSMWKERQEAYFKAHPEAAYNTIAPWSARLAHVDDAVIVAETPVAFDAQRNMT